MSRATSRLGLFRQDSEVPQVLPDVAVVGNVEFDHADIYPDLEAVFLAFRRFVHLVPRRGLVVLGADSEHAMRLRPFAHCRVETVGFAADADWRAADLEVTPQGTRFSVYRAGAPVDLFEVPLLGHHNVRNALVGIAVGRALGVPVETLKAALPGFRGVRRRLELRGEVAGIRVYDDFAHHPTAVAETLAALRMAHPDRRLWALFEPRSATSCLRVFEADFVRALAIADEVIVAAVFRTSVPDERRLSAEAVVAEIVSRGGSARYVRRPRTSSGSSLVRHARRTWW